MLKTALVLHGWPQLNNNQHFLVKWLKENGYRVIIPDLYKVKSDWTLDTLINYIISEIDGDEPDIIIGISMGGLILPHVAIKYPDSKLIFIATGLFFKPKHGLVRAGMIAADIKPIRKMFTRLSESISKELLEKLLRTFNPYNGDVAGKIVYEDDLQLNLNAIKDHSVYTHLKLLDLIKKIDNTEILKKLKNKSLILVGSKDMLMPKELGEYMHKTLLNSKLIINDGEHFNVIGEKDLPEVSKFLNV